MQEHIVPTTANCLFCCKVIQHKEFAIGDHTLEPEGYGPQQCSCVARINCGMLCTTSRAGNYWKLSLLLQVDSCSTRNLPCANLNCYQKVLEHSNVASKKQPWNAAAHTYRPGKHWKGTLVWGHNVTHAILHWWIGIWAWRWWNTTWCS